jgi:hypothetical protein
MFEDTKLHFRPKRSSFLVVFDGFEALPDGFFNRLSHGSRAPVPVIRQLADRLEIHRLRCGSPVAGPILANAMGKPLALSSAVNRVILTALNRCEACGKDNAMPLPNLRIVLHFAIHCDIHTSN